MSAIKLQFVLGAGLSSRLIAWYGQGYGGYSHVDAVLPDGSLLGARSDAVGGKSPGVQIRPQGYERWLKRCVVEIDATDAQAAAWEGWLRRQIGRPYDHAAIVGFILGRRLGDRGHWICSGCQFGALEAAGLLGPGPVPPDEVTPNALLLLVTAGLRGKILV